jgi:hypothetical protein
MFKESGATESEYGLLYSFENSFNRMYSKEAEISDYFQL